MRINYGQGPTKFGPGVNVDLTADEAATAIDAYLVAHKIYQFGARTVRVNGELIHSANVYIDPSGYVINEGVKISGRGPNDNSK